MQQAVQEVDPLLPFREFRTLDEVRRGTLALQQATAATFGSLALLAALLAGLGLYGLVAGSIAERTRELGIRIALGATPARALRTATGQSLLWAFGALAAGLATAWAAGRVVRSLLWGVSPTDTATFAAVAAIVAAIVLTASAIPAIRIVRMNPTRALRQ
jgi:ABC-type antimicrobial peptide transport system permease subunit